MNHDVVTVLTSAVAATLNPSLLIVIVPVGLDEPRPLKTSSVNAL